MPNRNLAKRSACLLAVKRLFEIGELNENLRPLPREEFEETEYDDNKFEQELRAGGDTNRKRLKNRELYPVKVSCISERSKLTCKSFAQFLELLQSSLPWENALSLLLRQNLPCCKRAHPQN